MAYNQRGLRTAATTPEGRVTSVVWDAGGRMSGVTIGSGAEAATTGLFYDAAGNNTRVRNGRGFDAAIGVQMQRLVAAAAAVVTLTTLGGCGSAGESPRESLLRSVEIAGFAKALTPMTISKQLIATFEPVSMGTQPPKTLDELEYSGIEIEPTPDQDFYQSCSDSTSVASGTFQTLRGCNASDSTDLAGVQQAIRVRVTGPSGSCGGVLYLGDRESMLNIGPNGNSWVMQLDLASMCEPATDR